MPKYISKDTIQEAVERLSVCSASSSLGDYLIFKRAAVLAGLENRKTKSESQPRVVTGTKSKTFVTAIDEFSATGAGTNLPPYFLPFGAKRDKTSGYRTPKFPSNGSSDTASRWQSRESKPIVLVGGTSPKTFVIERRSAKQLAEFFLAQNGSPSSFSGEKPSLLDTAVWWFRNTEFNEEPSYEALTQKLVNDLGLNSEELSGLFTTKTLKGA